MLQKFRALGMLEALARAARETFNKLSAKAGKT
jgi:hypothetical protein